MKVINEGHTYELETIQTKETDEPSFIVQFFRGPKGSGVDHVGTTNEEVLRMLIDRMRFLQQSLPCRENAIVITKLEEAFMWLEHRTNDRRERGVEGTIEV